MRFLIFLAILLSFPAFSLLFAVGSWWVLRGMEQVPRWARLLPAGVAVVLTGAFGWMVAARMMDVAAGLPGVVVAAVYLWHLFVVPLCLLVFGVVWVVKKMKGVSRERVIKGEASGAEEVEASGPLLTRRQALQLGLASFPAVMIVSATAASMPQLSRFRIRRIEVPLADLPAGLDGVRIAHLSDSHVGVFTEGRVLEEIARRTNELDPDLVVVTGDLINNSVEDLPAAMEMLRGIERQDRLFLCEGNHDLFQGHSAFRQPLLDAGFRLLLNEGARVEVRGVPVQLTGICWGEDGARRGAMLGEHTAAAREAADPDAFRILLAHHPEAFDYAQDVYPLTLAGHTHGGQIMLTRELGPGPLMWKYWSGLYRVESGAALVVSNGVGNWFPLRVNAPAEIVLVTLRRGRLERRGA